MAASIIDLKRRGDDRGWLIPLEANQEVPFAIHRVYYIFGTKPEVRRGMHAHKQLRQFAICVHGSCRFSMDDGTTKQEIRLSRLDQGLLIEPMIWHEMDEFTSDCVLLVLASARYAEEDYIRNYCNFLALINK